RPRLAAAHRVRRTLQWTRAARAVDHARRAYQSGGPRAGGARARRVSAPRHDRGADKAGPRRGVGRPGPGRTVAGHDHRSGHAAPSAKRSPRSGVVGPDSRGPRAHPVRKHRPGCFAAGRARSRSGRARHGAPGPRSLASGPGGVRHVREILANGGYVILVYFLALNSFYALLLILSIPEIWEQTRLAEDDDFQRIMQSDALPPISILVPAYNERAT